MNTQPAIKTASAQPEVPDLIRRAIEGDYVPKHEIMILGFALKTVRAQRDELLAALRRIDRRISRIRRKQLTGLPNR